MLCCLPVTFELVLFSAPTIVIYSGIADKLNSQQYRKLELKLNYAENFLLTEIFFATDLAA